MIEINGAVDFNDEYELDGGDVFALAVEPFVPIGVLPALAPVSAPVPLPVSAVSA